MKIVSKPIPHSGGKHDNNMGTELPSISTDEFRAIRAYIEEQCGIHLEPDKAYLVENRLTEILAQEHCRNFLELCHKARADHSNSLRDRIIDAITTRETSWFRDTVPFEILGTTLLEEAESRVRSGRRVDICVWCVGCATGQEPYSVAITILERLRSRGGLPPHQFRIVASDVSPSALVVAQTGRYNLLAISRGLSDELRDRYFTHSGSVWVISERVRQMVTFVRHNLLDPVLPVATADVVFCRNVLIYFSDELKRHVLRRLRSVLPAGGALLVGAAEAISPYTTEFEPVHVARGIYYRAR